MDENRIEELTRIIHGIIRQCMRNGFKPPLGHFMRSGWYYIRRRGKLERREQWDE